MLIRVTAEHIASGIRCHANLGPIALALIDAGFKNIAAYLDYTEIDGSRIPLPSEVGTFMMNFWYKGRSVQPFEFEIKIPFIVRMIQCLSK